MAESTHSQRGGGISQLHQEKATCGDIVASATMGREGAGTEGYTASVPPLVTSASRWGSHLGKPLV